MLKVEILFFLFFALYLCACDCVGGSGCHAGDRMLEADDFGFAKFTFAPNCSNYSCSTDTSINIDGDTSGITPGNVNDMKWVDTGLVASDLDVVVAITGAITPSRNLNAAGGALRILITNQVIDAYYLDQLDTTSTKNQYTQYGYYIGNVRQRIKNVGSRTDDVYGFDGSIDGVVLDGTARIYVKLIDTKYDDLSGGYNLTFFSGVGYTQKNGGSAVFAPLIKTIRDTTALFTQTIFRSLSQQTDFVRYIHAMLTLFVIFSAIKFMLGLSQLHYGQFIMLLLKAAFVASITSETSWEFFHGYFFSIFTDGFDELVALMIGDSSYSISDGNKFFDNMLFQIFNKENFMRIKSLSKGSGNFIFTFVFCYILVRFFIFKFMIFLMRAVLFYVMCIMTLGLLIALAPLFISFMLFEWTKSLFDAWINELLAYVFQPLMLMVFMGFVMMLFTSLIQDYMGYPVKMKQFGRSCAFNLFGWKPDICSTLFSLYYVVPDVSKTKANVLVPKYFMTPDNVSCGPYECHNYRYRDLPFLSVDGTNKYEASRASTILNGQYIKFAEIIYVLVLFNTLFGTFEVMSTLGRALISGQTFSYSGGAAMGVANSIGDMITDAAATAAPWAQKAAFKVGRPALGLVSRGAGAVGSFLDDRMDGNISRNWKSFKEMFPEAIRNVPGQIGSAIDSADKFVETTGEKYIYNLSSNTKQDSFVGGVAHTLGTIAYDTISKDPTLSAMENLKVGVQDAAKRAGVINNDPVLGSAKTPQANLKETTQPEIAKETEGQEWWRPDASKDANAPKTGTGGDTAAKPNPELNTAGNPAKVPPEVTPTNDQSGVEGAKTPDKNAPGQNANVIPPSETAGGGGTKNPVDPKVGTKVDPKTTPRT